MDKTTRSNLVVFVTIIGQKCRQNWNYLNRFYPALTYGATNI